MSSGIFSIGSTGMTASQALLNTVAHNISNVNTPGYSRQETQLATETGLFTGAGFYGRGVRVVTVSRSTNDFLTKEADINASAASGDQSRLDKLKQLEKVLPTGEAGLGYSASQLLNAFVDVANQPQDVSAKQVVIARAQEFVNRANTAGQQLTNLQAGVVSDTVNTVKQINELTTQIANINQDIAKFNGSGQQPNDLLDKRDLLLRNLNKFVQVSTVPASDGSLSVFMGGGQLLVLGNTHETLTTVHDPVDSSQVRVALTTAGNNRIINSDQITAGSLHGLLTFQDQDITTIRGQLNDFTSQFTAQVNAQQKLGLDSQGAQAITDIFTYNPAATPPAVSKVEDLQLNLKVPGGLGVAAPLVATLSSANKGTASINRLTAQPAAFSGAVTTPITISFVADPTSASNISYQVSPGGASQPWVPGTALVDSSSNAFSLKLNGVPLAGDTITIDKTNYPGANNGNALAMLDLRDTMALTLDGGASSANVTDTYSQMIGNLGVMVQSGQTASSISSTLSANSDQTLASATGVNLDEEAARLIQFQQSYQAAAKVLQVAQTVFDTLLSIQR